jgi:3-dehydrosphinganine reductase
MRVLVTGAGGFIGSYLVPELLKKGYTVKALFLPGEDATKTEIQGVEVIRGDLTAPETLAGIAKDIDVVFHLAGRVADWGPERLFREAIVDGTRNLLNACQSAGIRRFIYFSSIAALGFYRDQVGLNEDAERVRCGIPYCDAKIAAEELVTEFCQTHQIPYTIIRPANVIGPGSVWVKDVLDAFYRAPLPLIAGGKKPGAFVFVRNLVDGVLLATKSEQAANRTYHFRDDTGMTWGDYVTILGSWIGKKPFGSVPFWLARVVGAFLEVLLSGTSLRPLVTRLSAGVMGCDNDVDVSRARTELGWVSRVPAAEAMEEIRAWVEGEYRPFASAISKSFQNRLVFITGGSSGIGLETARLLSAKGAHLVLFARNSDRLFTACQEVTLARRTSRQRVAAISVDVSDSDDVQTKMKQAVAQFGPPDILIHSAGIIRTDYFENISYQEFDRVIKTNLYGVRNVTAALLPIIKQRGSHVVIIASAAGLMGISGYTVYSASKFGVVGLAECLRSELKPHGIPVTLVCPPEVQTPMLGDEVDTIPPETRAVKSLAGSQTPQYTAGKIVQAIVRKRFLVVPGWKFLLQYIAHCLSLGMASRLTSDAVINRVLRRKQRDKENNP